MDYAFVTYAIPHRRINFVAAENEFHRSKFKFVFNAVKVIPKKNFVPDLKTIKCMAQILTKEKEGTACIFPCGMSTASGAQHPSMLGTGKMIKHYGATVLGVRIHGGYFVSPKFDITERGGKRYRNPKIYLTKNGKEPEPRLLAVLICFIKYSNAKNVLKRTI